MILLINAGHGGWNPETKEYRTPPFIGKKTKHNNGKPYHNNGWFYEGVFNRYFAAEFIAQATKAGLMCIPVYMPIEDMPLEDIPKTANSIAEIVHTMYKQPCIFLSFHANSSSATTEPQTGAEGVCSFVYKLGTETAALAARITKRMEKVADAYGSKRRAQLVHDKPLTVTQDTKMPAILFEILFFDNPNNADLLMNPYFVEEIVRVMVEELIVEYGKSW